MTVVPIRDDQPEDDRPRIADLPDLATVDEVREVLPIGRDAVYAAVRSGELPSIRIGRRVLVPRAGLERLIEEAVADVEGDD